MILEEDPGNNQEAPLKQSKEDPDEQDKNEIHKVNGRILGKSLFMII
jgi:hypothetical protein